MLNKTMQRAVILLSGGLDSATTLAIAKSEGMRCYALTVDYGQRHQAELDAAVRVAHALQVAEHKIIRVNLNSIGGSALTDLAIAVPEQPTLGIPVTYVPARNTVLLALALGWAEVLRAEAIYIGVNALDYSGYPDCRPEFILAFQQLATLATKSGVEGKALRILAPLLYHSKADIIRCGQALGLDYSLTVSCYQADPQGRACGHCDSCRIRAQGFAAVGVTDPAI